MKTYVDYSHFAGEFNVEATLKIEDDGRFVYDELWSSYAGTTGGRADGIWWQESGAIFFRCESADGALLLEWSADLTRKAVEQTDTIEFFGGFTLHLTGAE